jgi:hypothetical protein
MKKILLFTGGAIAGYFVYEKLIKTKVEGNESFTGSKRYRKNAPMKAGLKFCKCTLEKHGCKTRVLTNEECDSACTRYCEAKPKKGFLK